MGKLNAPQGDSTQGNEPVSGLITKIAPTQLDLKEVLFKEIDLIQAAIARMANNSFQCKGWLFGILTLVLAIGKDSVFSIGLLGLLLLLPIVVFWYLDGFFLYVEQSYRDMYKYASYKRIDERFGTDKDFFDLYYPAFEHQPLKGKSFYSHLKLGLYNFFRKKENKIKHQAAKNIYKNDPPPARTILGTMASKTLLFLYFTPFVLVLLLSIGTWKGWLGKKEKKDALQIELSPQTIEQLSGKLKNTSKTELQPPATQKPDSAIDKSKPTGTVK